MSPRGDELVALMLDGGLDTAGQRELEAMLAADPHLVAEVAAAWRLHRLLPIVRRGPDSDHFAAQVRRRLQPESRRFRTQVGADIRAVARPQPRTRPRRRPTAVWLLPLAACLLIACTIWMAGARTAPEPSAALAVIESPAPDAVIIRAGTELDTAAGMALQPHDILRTAVTSITLRYPDRTRLECAARTRAEIWDERGAKRLRLESGTVEGDIAPQPAGSALRILTPEAQVEVVGTRLKVRSDASGTRLEVIEGVVSFTGADGTTRLVRTDGSAETAPRHARTTVLRYDFDDGRKPADVSAGEIIDGHGTGNAHGLGGTMRQTDGGKLREVLFERRSQALFAYRPDLLLAFDCRHTSAHGAIVVGFWDPVRQQHLSTRVEVPAGPWSQVVVRLADCHAADAPGATCTPGTDIFNLAICVQIDQDSAVLELDDLALVRESR